MNVMAGFGSAIQDPYNINLINVGGLTSDALAKNHLIFVGNSSAFPLLSDVKFKLPIVNGKFANMPNETQLMMEYCSWQFHLGI